MEVLEAVLEAVLETGMDVHAVRAGDCREVHISADLMRVLGYRQATTAGRDMAHSQPSYYTRKLRGSIPRPLLSYGASGRVKSLHLAVVR